MTEKPLDAGRRRRKSMLAPFSTPPMYLGTCKTKDDTRKASEGRNRIKERIRLVSNKKRRTQQKKKRDWTEAEQRETGKNSYPS